MVREREKKARPAELSGVVYGVRVHGRLPEAFRPYLLGGGVGGGDLAGSVEVSHRLVEELPTVEEIWVSEAEGPRFRGRFALFRQPEGFGLTVAAEGRGLFVCGARAIRIEWTAPGTGAAHYLFSYALPLWLETRGVPVLHGSAVAVGGRAVAFLGPSGTGKSVLCAELMRLGCGFLADDALALHRDQDRGGSSGEGPEGEGEAGRAARSGWRCAPGPPLMRLWPTGIEGRLEIAAGGLPKVHDTLEKRWLPLSGEGSAPPPSGLPLAAVYVLARRPEGGGPVDIAGYGARDALVRLIEHSVAAGPAAALGLSGGRLELLAGLVEGVPVRRLGYPSGAGSARQVLEGVLRDQER